MRAVEGLKRLVEQARKDPAFFHALVFDPEKVISRLDYLDRKTKGALLQIEAELLVRNLIPQIVTECGDTCGAGSCTDTCGSGSCIETCKSSCGGTCASSCNKTSGLEDRFVVEDPLGQLVAGGAAQRSATRRTGRKSQR